MAGLQRASPARICIVLLALVTIVSGVGVLVLGIKARTAEEFHELSALLSVESNDVFDTEQVVAIVLGLVIGVIICGVAACAGAISQKQCMLCGVTAACVVLGLWLLTLCLVMKVFLKTQGPVIAKALNRVCGPGAQQPLKEGLGCASHKSQSQASVAGLHTTSTAAPFLVRPTAAPAVSPQGADVAGGEEQEKLRRRHLSASSTASTAKIVPQVREVPIPMFMSRAAITLALAIEAPSLLAARDASLRAPRLTARGGGNASGARRLFPGTTEEGLLVRTCSRLGPSICPSPCDLLDIICVEPPDFDAWTACVCDRSGPRVSSPTTASRLTEAPCERGEGNPMCEMDSLGRRMGVFCIAPTPALTEGDGSEKESCFVLPTAKCKSGTDPPDCGAAANVPCTSTGPCTNPDSLSQLFIDGRETVDMLVLATGVFGGLAMLVALCSCCLCAELHTGQSASENVRRLAQNDPSRQPWDDELLFLTDDEG